MTADPNGQYLDVNNRACQMLGYTREELFDLRVPTCWTRMTTRD